LFLHHHCVAFFARSFIIFPSLFFHHHFVTFFCRKFFLSYDSSITFFHFICKSSCSIFILFCILFRLFMKVV
jgi:hypothetical protein